VGRLRGWPLSWGYELGDHPDQQDQEDGTNQYPDPRGNGHGRIATHTDPRQTLVAHLDLGGAQACTMLRLSSREGHQLAFDSNRGARLG
jgi:hypothetical protein